MNYIFQAVTISHSLQFKHSRPFLILKPKIISTYKSCSFKWMHSLKWHLPQVLHVLCSSVKTKIICWWIFGICQLWRHVITRKGYCWGTWEATIPFAHWHHCYDWEFVHSITQRLIYFTVSYGSFTSFCIQFVCCRHIRLDECRQEFYFIILKPSNYTCTINIDREVKRRLCCNSPQELQMAEGRVLGRCDNHSRKPCLFYWCIKWGPIPANPPSVMTCVMLSSDPSPRSSRGWEDLLCFCTR